jgi:hypothetical protein
MSQREIGQVLGVSPGTINEDLRIQNRTGNLDFSREKSIPAVQNRTDELIPAPATFNAVNENIRQIGGLSLRDWLGNR